jgi:hypothetical protein
MTVLAVFGWFGFETCGGPTIGIVNPGSWRGEGDGWVGVGTGGG